MEDKLRLIEDVNDELLVIVPDMSRPVSPFDLPTAELTNETLVSSLDLIDILTIKEDTYLRVRNVQN